MTTRTEPFHVTLDEYLNAERLAEFRSEYFDGVVRAVVDTRVNHSRVTTDTACCLGGYLVGRECDLFTVGMKVWMPRMYRVFLPGCGRRL